MPVWKSSTRLCSARSSILLAIVSTMLLGSCAQSAGSGRAPMDAGTSGAPPASSATTVRADVARGTLRTDSLWSAALNVWKRLIVYLPPGYASSPRERYPVAYYLHGMWGSEGDWSTQGNIHVIADSLIAGGMSEIIIAMPDGDNSYYTTWATPGNYDACRREPPIPEPAGSYCVPAPRYDEYIARDVVGYVDSTYRTRASPEHRAVAGLSMGGYGAVTLALRRPDVWSAAASHSGVMTLILGGRDANGVLTGDADAAALEERWGSGMWHLIEPVFGRDTADWWAREPTRIAERRATTGAEVPALFIDVGTDDRLVIPGNRIFRDELRRLGIPMQYSEWPGAHTWSYWRAHVPESLTWIAERIAR